nr:MAG: hypothetical protein DIU60_10510 [Actinomycetota bacterium]
MKKIVTGSLLCTLAAAMTTAATTPAQAAAAAPAIGTVATSPGPASPGGGGSAGTARPGTGGGSAGTARPGRSGGGTASPGGVTRRLGPTCIGSSCTGRDPVATRCYRDARTYSSHYRPAGGPWLKVRYSSRCHTAWVQQGRWSTGLRAMIQIRNGASYTVRANPYRATYTRMVYSSLPYRACAEQSNGTWLCTDWM